MSKKNKPIKNLDDVKLFNPKTEIKDLNNILLSQKAVDKYKKMCEKIVGFLIENKVEIPKEIIEEERMFEMEDKSLVIQTKIGNAVLHCLIEKDDWKYADNRIT